MMKYHTNKTLAEIFDMPRETSLKTLLDHEPGICNYKKVLGFLDDGTVIALANRTIYYVDKISNIVTDEYVINTDDNIMYIYKAVMFDDSNVFISECYGDQYQYNETNSIFNTVTKKLTCIMASDDQYNGVMQQGNDFIVAWSL